jgi:transcriptional regulator with XRE-family HTH domain
MAMQKAAKTEMDLYIINKVRQLREKHNFSQAVLAAKLDVSGTFVGLIENPKNRAKYNLVHINKLAKIFDCSPRDFLPENPI